MIKMEIGLRLKNP